MAKTKGSASLHFKAFKGLQNAQILCLQVASFSITCYLPKTRKVNGISVTNFPGSTLPKTHRLNGGLKQLPPN